MLKIMVLILGVTVLLGASLYTVFVKPIPSWMSAERWIAIVNRTVPDPWYRRLAVWHYWWSRKLFFGDKPLLIPVDVARPRA